jgi:hypothetical protein
MSAHLPAPPEFDQDAIEDYILMHAEQILVRAMVDGEWRNARLTELPVRDALEFVIAWLRKGHMPAQGVKKL